MRQTRKDEKLSGEIAGQYFCDILFDSLSISQAKITKTRFNNVHFKNSQLGKDSDYIDCEFTNCKFLGKYSTLGFSTQYSNCKFIDCKFIGGILFADSKFYNCTFSGIIKNSIISDKKEGLFGKSTGVFNNCDLRHIIFDNLSIYGSIGLSDCVLPHKGIRKFQNDKDSLIQKAYDICSKISSQDKIESEVLFRRDLKAGQNPIVLDDLFLDSYFKTADSRRIFDTIVDGFEIV